MSRERALRRAEREQAAAEAETARLAEAERRSRRAQRRTALTRWLPRSAGAGGVLAARRRQQTGLVVSFVVTINALTLLGTDTWAPRVFVLLLSVLLTPIVLSLMSRR